MTLRGVTSVSFDARRIRLGFAALLALSSAGCASDTTPTASGQAQSVATATPAFARPGEFPNLNVIPKPATTQITPEEKTADTTMLQSIRNQHSTLAKGPRARDESGALRTLARSHAGATLKEIEGE